MGNLLSLNPKIHRLDTDAEKCGGVPDGQREFFAKEPCAHARFLAFRAAAREVVWGTHALLYGIFWIPQNVFYSHAGSEKGAYVRRLRHWTRRFTGSPVPPK